MRFEKPTSMVPASSSAMTPAPPCRDGLSRTSRPARAKIPVCCAYNGSDARSVSEIAMRTVAGRGPARLDIIALLQRNLFRNADDFVVAGVRHQASLDRMQGTIALERGDYGVDRLRRGVEGEGGEDHRGRAGGLERRQIETGSTAGLRNVGQLRSGYFPTDPPKVFDRVGTLHEDHIGSSLDVEPSALDRRLDPLDAECIRPGCQEERVVTSGVERRFDLRDHLLDRDERLTREITAALGKGLILDEQACGAGAF